MDSSHSFVREVWNYNWQEELEFLSEALKRYTLVSVDTEFPGHLCKTSRNARDENIYDNVYYNVNSTKLIQLGLTVGDKEGSFFATWEFNFRFNPESDSNDYESIQFLKKNNFDFESLETNGIDVNEFAGEFGKLISACPYLEWITFHGLYDLSYLMRIIQNNALLPDKLEGFAKEAGQVFKNVYDVKFIAKSYHGEIGLERLARELGIERVGSSHHAGSDSLVTAQVFHEIICRYGLDCEDENGMKLERANGFLSGLNTKIGATLSQSQYNYNGYPYPSSVVARSNVTGDFSGIETMLPQSQYNYFGYPISVVANVPCYPLHNVYTYV